MTLTVAAWFLEQLTDPCVAFASSLLARSPRAAPRGRPALAYYHATAHGSSLCADAAVCDEAPSCLPWLLPIVSGGSVFCRVKFGRCNPLDDSSGQTCSRKCSPAADDHGQRVCKHGLTDTSRCTQQQQIEKPCTRLAQGGNPNRFFCIMIVTRSCQVCFTRITSLKRCRGWQYTYHPQPQPPPVSHQVWGPCGASHQVSRGMTPLHAQQWRHDAQLNAQSCQNWQPGRP